MIIVHNSKPVSYMQIHTMFFLQSLRVDFISEIYIHEHSIQNVTNNGIRTKATTDIVLLPKNPASNSDAMFCNVCSGSTLFACRRLIWVCYVA